jgi:hypothetical protein
MNICRMEKAREREREKPSHAKRRELQGFFWLPLSYFASLPLLGCLIGFTPSSPFASMDHRSPRNKTG